MLKILNNQYVWKTVLVLFVATACQAQTKCPAQNDDTNKNKPSAAKEENPDNEKSDDKCDFSDLKTIKQVASGIVSMPKPAYPEEADEKNIVGNVSVHLLINRAAEIEQACKIEGDDILAVSALKAAKRIRMDKAYVKRRLEGKEQNYLEFVITYKFAKLSPKPDN